MLKQPSVYLQLRLTGEFVPEICAGFTPCCVDMPSFAVMDLSCKRTRQTSTEALARAAEYLCLMVLLYNHTNQ